MTTPPLKKQSHAATPSDPRRRNRFVRLAPPSAVPLAADSPTPEPCLVEMAPPISPIGHIVGQAADESTKTASGEQRGARDKRPWFGRGVVVSRMLAAVWAASVMLCLAGRWGVRGTCAAVPRSAFSMQSTAQDEIVPVLTGGDTASRALSSSPDDCVNLTLALLPYSVSGFDALTWSFHSIDGGEAVSWGQEYADPALHNTTLVEHSADRAICFAPGKYVLDVDRGHAWYVLSMGEWVRCGYLEPSLAPLSMDLYRPGDDEVGGSERQDSECPVVSCAEDSCFERVFKPLQCYHNFDVFSLQGISNGTASWLNEDCADILEEACENGALGFEVGASAAGIERFCDFFQCAYPLYRQSLDGSYRASCACLYSSWVHEVGLDILNSAHFSQHKCCIDKNKQHSDKRDVETNCECVVEPSCTNGDDVMCEDALEYCCSTNQGARECNYLERPCENSIEQNRTDFDGDFLYCLNSTVIRCKDDPDEYGCQCTYWESLCAEYPGGATCEKALMYCCGSDDVSSCDCDFLELTWKSTGYKYNLMDVACSIAEKNIIEHSTVENDRIVLNQIYQQLGGRWWINNRGWLNNETSHCSWYGVSCNDKGRVSRLELINNNLTGKLLSPESKDGKATNREAFIFGGLYELEILVLANNWITGSIPHNSHDLFDLRLLYFVDLSGNELTGVADILFSPSILYLNFSYNNFSSIGHIPRYNLAYSTIQIVDLSDNMINQDIADVLLALPLNLEKLGLSNNYFFGTLPNQLPVFEDLYIFVANNNYLSGSLIDFSRAMPRLAEIELANQKHLGQGGITGTIPTGISSLFDLIKLDLSGNQLKGSVPARIGNLPGLRWLDLSDNKLRGTISHNFGKLAGVSNVFDVSRNNLTGTIPASFKDFKEGLVRFSGNEMLSFPAPLGLCYDSRTFDLAKNIKFCPPQRNALHDIFNMAKGQEWTTSSGWDSQFADTCAWYGVVCDNKTKALTGLNLPNNGLSGMLSPKIGDLRSLEYIDLSDNDIKGSVPDNICKLSNLKVLRLNYNDFSGTMPSELDQLQNLELVQLQRNRLSGEILLNSHAILSKKYGDSSFVSDCGVPTDFEDSLKCMSCTMCCNVQGECHSTSTAYIPLGYESFSWIVLLSIFSFLVLITVTPMCYKKYRKPPLSRTIPRELVVSEKLNAWSTIGSDSVYSFFLSRSVLAWTIALSVISFQSFVFFFFIQAAEISFEDDKKSFIYSWRCPRNSIECEDKNDKSAIGWFMFSVLLVSHLLKDVVNGGKLLFMSTKNWHHRNRRIRFFIGGIILILITVLATYATTVYNIATARSNTELVSNAVIILFLTDVDEQFHRLIKVICPKWLDGLTRHLNHPQHSSERQEQRGNENHDIAEDATTNENTLSLLEICSKLHQMEARLNNTVQTNKTIEI